MKVLVTILMMGTLLTQASPKITLSMIMKNEADRYLKSVLESAKPYIDDAVIIDDGSTDDSIVIAQSVLSDIPLKIIKNKDSKFHNEVSLRKQQWLETTATNPEWILCLDADEQLEPDKKSQLISLIEQNPEAEIICFRLYDFWNATHYREDQYWHAHFSHRAFLVKFKQKERYSWKEQPQHCGRWPLTIIRFKAIQTNIRIKHLGWSKPEDRQAKYERYMKFDPGAHYGWKEQYESILDPNPRLIEWSDVIP